MAEVKLLKVDKRILLQVGDKKIEVADYNLKSSADGSTELSIVLKGHASIFELSANLEEQRK